MLWSLGCGGGASCPEAQAYWERAPCWSYSCRQAARVSLGSPHLPIPPTLPQALHSELAALAVFRPTPLTWPPPPHPTAAAVAVPA